MRPNFKVIIPLALIIAAILGLFLSHYINTHKSLIKKEPEKIVENVEPVKVNYMVLIFNQDMPPGTMVTRSSISWENWPSDMLQTIRNRKGFIIHNEREGRSYISGIVGSITRDKFYKGDIVTANKLIYPTDRGSTLSYLLRPGYRAFSMPFNPLTSSGGMIAPGDYVDVILANRLTDQFAGKINPSNGQTFPSEAVQTILKSIKVLAIDHNFGSIKLPVNPKMLILEVTPKQYDKLILASSMGVLFISVKSYDDINKKISQNSNIVTDVDVIPDLIAKRMHKDVSNVKELDPFTVIESKDKITKDFVTIYNGGQSESNVELQNGQVVMGNVDGISVINGPLPPKPTATEAPKENNKTESAEQQPKKQELKKQEVPYAPYISPAYIHQFVK
jgi:pilus assembly protein CpaB